MQDILTIAQIVFYSSFSLLIIGFGIITALIFYNIIKLIKELKELTANANKASEEVVRKIQEILDQLSLFPILSFFFKKMTGKDKEKVNNKKEK